MRTLLALALLAGADLALAQPPTATQPERPQEMPALYICSVRQDTPFGEVHAQQSVSLTGEVGVPIFRWETWIVVGDIWFTASWTHDRDYSLVQIQTLRLVRGRTYRLRLEQERFWTENRGPTHPTELFLDSGPMRAEGPYWIATDWPALTAAFYGPVAPRSVRFVLYGDDGSRLESEPFALDRLIRARAMADALQPALAPLVADYANNCRFYPARLE